MTNAEWRMLSGQKSAAKPMVAALGEPESGLLDTWRAMRVFC